MTATLPSSKGLARDLSEDEREHMRGVSWKDDPRCPTFEALALLELPFWDFDGREQRGELVVRRALASEVVGIFETIYAARFPIAAMKRIDHFDADDERSMEANNCSSFCFREIAIGGGLSQHAFGAAIDINPLQNPYVISDGDGSGTERVFPQNGRAFLDRTDRRPGMLIRPCPVIEAFEAAGWEWGGDWTTCSDYHHFSKLGVVAL